MNARTVARPLSVRGIGLVCRHPVETRFLPAPPGTGLLFREKEGGARVLAGPATARAGRHYTELVSGRSRFRVIEHLLAVCFGLGITDMVIECPDREPPFGDGSGRHFLRAITRVGVLDSGFGPAALSVRETTVIKAGGGLIVIRPATEMLVRCITEFSWTGTEWFDWSPGPGAFERELADARTVAYTEECVESLSRSLDLRFQLRRCAGFVIPARSRMAGETCRHKLLDLLGDLALLGRPLEAELLAYRPGHRLNLQLVRRLAG